MLNKDCGFGTKAIHAGNVKDTQYGALTTPIFQTSLSVSFIMFPDKNPPPFCCIFRHDV